MKLLLRIAGLLPWTLVVLAGHLYAAPAQTPLFLVKGATPMVMFAMSADHQLFMKAFADYTDLDKDGQIDITYTDTFDYYGYFDSNRCYSYSSDLFVPEEAASGPNSHHCPSGNTGQWSGNFLNWATMTRIDVLRKALYGGKRAVDSTSQTVLQRELLPEDVHAFVKVFTAPSGDSTQNYTPYSNSTISLCNVTPVSTGLSHSLDTSLSANYPKVRVASGAWGRWAADEVYQCAWRGTAGSSPTNASNLFSAGSDTAPSVRVAVCADNKLESNCKDYDPADVAIDPKPVGLLQDYGEDGTLRFGLTTGSYVKRDEGGVLRKIVSQIANNTTLSLNEVNTGTGQFISGAGGIIETIDALRINQWNYGTNKYADCNTYGIPIASYLSDAQSYSRSGSTYDATCSNWGNPLSELYLETVRYLTGEGSATGTFDVATDALGLGNATWNDPMASNEWCTPMNIVVLSSGDNSFDTDSLTTGVPSEIGSVSAAVNQVGTAEGVSGGNYFVGEVGATPVTNPDSNICSPKAVSSLSNARGLCPATPTKQGGYGIAGIAAKARTSDVRSDRINDPDTGDGQSISTYAIAMAKSLPDFVFKVGNGEITIVPNAYAGPTNRLPNVVSNDWSASSLAQVNVEETVYDANDNLTYVRFIAHWEDSAWGNDYDMDVVSRVSICLADECANHDDDNSGLNDLSPGADTLRVTTRIVHKYAGVSVKVGFIASGTTADGEYTTLRYQNGGNFSASDFDNDNASREPTPTVYTFTAGTSSATTLPTPLELAAKYGRYGEMSSGSLTVASDWDSDSDGFADSFFFADDPSQIGPRLASFLNTISTTSSASAVVANSVSFESSTRIYQARFDSENWTGQLLSFRVDPQTGAVVDENTATPNLLDPEWDSATVITAQYSTPTSPGGDDGRSIITLNPTSGLGVPFQWASIDTGQQAALNTNPATGSIELVNPQGEDRLSYLRGESAKEARFANGVYRNRGEVDDDSNFVANLLGDNVNSSPAVVGKPLFGYVDTLESTATGNNPPNNLYSTFVNSWDNVDCDDTGREREPIVYFGANDGMLHGVSACNGAEWIAYVPNSIYPSLTKLTSPSYQHQYFVDGAPTIVDAFWERNNTDQWGTVLVGSMRAGGSGVFALDVTDPSLFSNESNAADIVLWEINAATTGFADLGYTFSQPAVVTPQGDEEWVALFGNGYSSANGKAVLYAVDIEDGNQDAAIVLDAGPGNGLSTVAPLDRDQDGRVDLVYAGDLKGNVWRIEPGSQGFSNANVRKLYQALTPAGVPQPITSRMEVGRHPSAASGRIVMFGTGKYFEPTDNNPALAVANTVYGIFDDDSNGTVDSRNVDATILQEQTVDFQTSATSEELFGYEIRIVSDESVDWSTQRGWYLDLPTTGEKVVSNPILRGGRLIFVTTIPSTAPCDAGGTSWLMEIDSANGGRIDQPVFDFNGDTNIDLADTFSNETANLTDVPVSGKKSKVGILQPPAIVAGVGGDGTGGFGKAEAKYSSGSKKGEIDVTIEDVGLPSEGRKSWLQFK